MSRSSRFWSVGIHLLYDRNHRAWLAGQKMMNDGGEGRSLVSKGFDLVGCEFSRDLQAKVGISGTGNDSSWARFESSKEGRLGLN